VLATVQDPALKIDFVSAGMVKDVTVDGGRVRVAIELTTPACPSRDVIVSSIQAAVGRLPWSDRGGGSAVGVGAAPADDQP
jgi:ATP-binding protein involved in chromosome partitioning